MSKLQIIDLWVKVEDKLIIKININLCCISYFAFIYENM